MSQFRQKLKLLSFAIVFGLSFSSAAQAADPLGGIRKLCSVALEALSGQEKAKVHLGLLREGIGRYQVMETGGYFGKKREKGRTFVNIDVIPGLVKTLRDRHHYSREEVNALLLEMKRVFVETLESSDLIEVEAAFADFRGIRLIVKNYEEQKMVSLIADAINRINSSQGIRSNQFGRLHVGEVLSGFENGSNFQGLYAVAIGNTEAQATFAARSQRLKNKKSHIPEVMISSFEKMKDASVLGSLHAIDIRRQKIVEELADFSRGNRAIETVKIDGTEQKVLSFDIFSLLRKSEGVEEVRAGLAKLLEVDEKEISDQLISGLSSLKTYYTVLEPALVYRPEEIVRLNKLDGQERYLPPGWVASPKWAAYTDVVGVGAYHMRAMQLAIAEVAPKKSIRGKRKEIEKVLEDLHRAGFGSSLKRLQEEMDRSLEVFQALGMASVDTEFSDYSGDERRIFYMGEFLAHDQIMRSREDLGSEQRLTFVRSSFPNNKKLSLFEFSRLREFGEFISKEISERFYKGYFALELNKTADGKISLIVHVDGAEKAQELSRKLRPAWLKQFVEKEYGELFDYELKLLIEGK